MKIVTMIPTYNEAGNIERIINEVLNCLPDSYVLTVDDMSPDGTYKIVQDISKLDKNVSLLLRTHTHLFPLLPCLASPGHWRQKLP